jgi:hypothetical protein
MTPAAYFPGEEPALQALLDGFLADLAARLRAQPFAPQVRVLLLAGGYGRGEGGVFVEKPGASAQLYNDLEFYLIVEAAADLPAIEQWCTAESHRGDEALGIEVEFKVLRESAFLAAEPNMFYYDLLAAHRVVHGPADFAAQTRPELRDPAKIPLTEVTRLLFNRGTGLFYSRFALETGSERVTNGFVERNHAKVRLALADAVLAAQGRYHFSCRERHRRLPEVDRAKLPPDWEQIAAWHAEGIEFKLHPRHRHPSREALDTLQAELVAVWLRTFLWAEGLRLGRSFTPENYGHGGRLFPETSIPKNLALHLRDRLKRGGALPAWTDYPRAALQRALVSTLAGNPTAAAQHLGAARDADPQSTYERWWRFYN